MAYRFRTSEKLPRGVRRIVMEELDLAMGGLLDPASDLDRAIHEARKRLKKSRALLRTVRDALGKKRHRKINKRLRDAGRSLSETRDSAVRVRTLDKVFEGWDDPEQGQSLRGTRRLLVSQHAETLEACGGPDRSGSGSLQDALELMKEGWRQAQTLPLVEDGFPVLAPGIRRSYSRARKDARQAYKSGEEERFHEWRKSIKDLWYQVRLLEPAWPAALGALERELHALAEMLGDLHDVDVLAHHLEGSGDLLSQGVALERILEGLREERQRLRQSAKPLADRILAEPADAFLARIEAYWTAWKREEPTNTKEGGKGSPQARRVS